MSEDRELERILEEKRKRLLNKLAKTSGENKPQKSVDDVDRVVLSLLDEKGREILSIAEQDFPVETRRAKLVLYALVKKGFVTGPVDAGDLYRFLRYLGIPVRYEARIVVADGKDRKPLSEILSERMAELEEQEFRFYVSVNQKPIKVLAQPSYVQELLRSKISIVLPASVIGVSDDLRVKTFRAGLIGRAAAIFMIDEITIYLDDREAESISNQKVFTKLLRYMVVPQYLRRIVFKKEEALRFAGLLPPLKIPSHTVPSSLKHASPGSFRLASIVKANDGKVVLEAGLEKRLTAPVPSPPLEAKEGSVVLIKIEDISRLSARIVDHTASPFYLGYRVSSPRVTLGEFLKNVNAVKIGTSKYGEPAWQRLSKLKEIMSKNERIMIVFGSPSMGLREILAKEKIKAREVFDILINTVGDQGTETVRTEEALYITLPLVTSLARGVFEA